MIKVIEYNNGYIAEDVILLLGYFDGMHIGHQKLLEIAREKQAETGYKISIINFLGSCSKVEGSKFPFNVAYIMERRV